MMTRLIAFFVVSEAILRLTSSISFSLVKVTFGGSRSAVSAASFDPRFSAEKSKFPWSTVATLRNGVAAPDFVAVFPNALPPPAF